jgi:hypothetical protein
MTYSDIYTKFLIEYDKQNITSSYPSLTVYEIGTILDKAYLALIAQKLTGNNPRRAPFEIDIKAIEDLRPLIKTTEPIPGDIDYNTQVSNVTPYELSIPDYLYFVNAKIYTEIDDRVGAGKRITKDPIRLVNHAQFDNFVASSSNIPWIKTPVGCLEGNHLLVATDPFTGYIDPQTDVDFGKKYPYDAYHGGVIITYVKRPQPFILEDDSDAFHGHVVNGQNVQYEFELNDSMAEELINLAIVMALETVESPRLQMKEQTRALES